MLFWINFFVGAGGWSSNGKFSRKDLFRQHHFHDFFQLSQFTSTVNVQHEGKYLWCSWKICLNDICSLLPLFLDKSPLNPLHHYFLKTCWWHIKYYYIYEGIRLYLIAFYPYVSFKGKQLILYFPKFNFTTIVQFFLCTYNILMVNMTKTKLWRF